MKYRIGFYDHGSVAVVSEFRCHNWNNKSCECKEECGLTIEQASDIMKKDDENYYISEITWRKRSSPT